MQDRGSQAEGGLRAQWRRLRRDRRGATAVEFALVAGPFFFAMLAIMEVAMVMWQAEVMEKAVSVASRKIYTGEFQAGAGKKTTTQLRDEVKDIICAEVSPVINCTTSKLAVDVRPIAGFSTSPPSPINAQKTYDTSAYSYGSVAAKQIGLVTASIEYQTFFPPMSGTALANGNRVIMATSAFRAEPYVN